MIGSTCPIRAVLPIPFPSHVPRIGIFCLTHRCWPVLLPAGRTRSSSLVSRYEDCFKPMALQVPGSPLPPYRTASGFSGPCRSTCWCKTGRDCISQGNSWKLAYLLRTFAALHLPLMELLQCQFWDGWGLSTLPAETRNCGAYRIKLKSPDWKSSLEISHIEWEAAWNKNPHRAENFHSFLASLMI